jgi:hypothetical protein
MAGEEAQEWRLTVTTEGYQLLQFKVPCGDGSLTILELTQKVAERCQRMLPHTTAGLSHTDSPLFSSGS